MVRQDQIICGDCLDVMRDIDDESIDFMITSPPYNVGTNYDIYDDNRPWIDYVEFIQRVMIQVYRVIKPDGRIAINISHVVKNKSWKPHKHFPLSDFLEILLNTGFNIREIISWFKASDANHFSGGSTSWGSWKSASNPYLRGQVEVIIVANKARIIFWDNNWFASPNFEKDIEKIKKLGKVVDFNQGLDCRLFNEEKAKLLSTIRITPLRFAFDNSSQEGNIQNAIRIAQKYDFKDIRVYILYNSSDPKDTLEYFYYRINEINQLGALSYPMRYRPISINGKYISPNWDSKLLRALQLSLMFYYYRGMIRQDRKAFENIYGKEATEFKKNLYKLYEEDKRRERK